MITDDEMLNGFINDIIEIYEQNSHLIRKVINGFTDMTDNERNSAELASVQIRAYKKSFDHYMQIVYNGRRTNEAEDLLKARVAQVVMAHT